MGEPAAYRQAVAEVLVSEEELRATVARLASDISRDYAGRPLVMVGVLNGAAVFLADLLRALDIPAEVDFLGMASYGCDTVSCGEVRLTKDVILPLAGKDVLVVEDIVDTGRTVARIVDCLAARGAASVKVCALLDKPSRREIGFRADYVGVEIPDRFVVGYGIDFAQHYRGLPYVAVLRPEAYRSEPALPATAGSLGAPCPTDPGVRSV